MPFFVPNERIRILEEKIAEQKAQLRDWHALSAFLEIARELQREVIALVKTPTETARIGSLAYTAVLERHVDEARREHAAQHEREHRKTLYRRVLEEIESQEGEEILAATIARLETDAALMAELQHSARKELADGARGTIQGRLSKEQAVVVAAEADRQIALDRFDVAFALTGTIDLTDPSLRDLLKHGDKLAVLLEEDDVGQTGHTFTWAEDVNGQVGWIVGDPIADSKYDYYRNYTQVQTGHVPGNRFVSLGSQIPDLVRGKQAIKNDTLVAGYPLAISWQTAADKTNSHVVQVAIQRSGYGYLSPAAAPGVVAIDFQVGTLDFGQRQYAT